MSSLWSALTSLWSSLLQALGLADKEASLLILGLDNAGKTTLLQSLAGGGRPYRRTVPPTDRPRRETFRHGGVTFRTWDLGGHEAVRHLWADYYGGDDVDADEHDGDVGAPPSVAASPPPCSHRAVSAVLFVIDAADEARLEEAGYELDHLLAPPPPAAAEAGPDGPAPPPPAGGGSHLRGVPVAVLCNKCDLPAAVATETVRDRIDYDRLARMHGPHLVRLFRTSVLTGQGYGEALAWLNTFL